MRKNVKKVEPDIKRWLKLMGEKRYDEAEELNLKKIYPVLGKGALPYAPTKKEIANPNEFLKIVSCSVQVRDDQPSFCEEEGYPREKGCYNPYAVCRESVKIGSKQTRKRKPSAFNRCVGNTLLAAIYKNKKQWQGEFKKAVKKCRSNPAPISSHHSQLISRGKIDISRHKSPTMLMTKEMERTLPPLYSTEEKKPEGVTVHAHYFTPFSNWDWYITEYDGKDTMFGLVKGHEVELGYVSLSKLKSQGANIERDLYWSKKSLAQVMKDTNYPHYVSKKNQNF